MSGREDVVRKKRLMILVQVPREKSPYLSIMTDAMTPAECQTSLRRIHHHPHSGEMSYQGDTTCGISVAFFKTLANSKLFILPPVLKVCHRNGIQFVCGRGLSGGKMRGRGRCGFSL